MFSGGKERVNWKKMVLISITDKYFKQNTLIVEREINLLYKTAKQINIWFTNQSDIIHCNTFLLARVSI